jgi:hypothetical protein
MIALTDCRSNNYYYYCCNLVSNDILQLFLIDPHLDNITYNVNFGAQMIFQGQTFVVVYNSLTPKISGNFTTVQ